MMPTICAIIVLNFPKNCQTIILLKYIYTFPKNNDFFIEIHKLCMGKRAEAKLETLF